VLAGGYPEAVVRKSEARRSRWLTEYARALARRDVAEIAEVNKPDQMWDLLLHMAVRNGQLLNAANLSSDVGVDAKTIARWVGLFEQLFVVHRLKAWHSNQAKRLVRAPKLHFLDSGLVAALQGVDHSRITENRSLFGSLLETFVFAELRKAMSLSPALVSISHYRDKDQTEVDFVLERSPGHIVGVEVKSTATIRPADFKGLIRLRDAAAEHFKLGVILHDGERVMQFGDRLVAAPVSVLW
jgi:predicted AAA+ superfamily ATPase